MKYWENSYEYKRLLQILDEYWLSEIGEQEVVIEMKFKHQNGVTQEKKIVWRNDNRDWESMKKCPFCGGAVLLENKDNGIIIHHKHRNCIIGNPIMIPKTFGTTNAIDIIRAWNRRTDDDDFGKENG